MVWQLEIRTHRNGNLHANNNNNNNNTHYTQSRYAVVKINNLRTKNNNNNNNNLLGLMWYELTDRLDFSVNPRVGCAWKSQ